MKAEILTVGTELLIGQIVNTNATWLAQELALLGVDVLWMTTVGDNAERMDAAIATAAARADLVILTGGLGPTPDDMTVEAIARHLGEPLVERPEARAHVEAIFASRRRVMSPSNLKQALFPPSAELIPNPAGTAMGLAGTSGACRIWAFPGVPVELKAMWAEWARPRLEAAAGATIRSTLLRYMGIPEATLAEQVADKLAMSNPTVAPYAGAGEVHLRVTAKAESPAAAAALLAPVVEELQAIAPYYYGADADSLPVVVGRALTARGQTLAVAESMTGGLLASRLTDVPGASAFFIGGVVSYATATKRDVLGVDAETIERHGVVSAEVATAMAQAARQVLKAEWALAITGYAGPGPGVDDQAVGLVFIGLAGPGVATSVERRFGARSARETIKHLATQQALDLLRTHLA